MIEWIAMIPLLLQPGSFLVKKSVHKDGTTALLLALALSAGINGAVFYYLSLFFQLSKTLILFYSLVMLLLFLPKDRFFKLNKIEKIKNEEKLLLAISSITMLMYFLLCFGVIIAYDTLSYHLPVINEFSKNGKLPSVENPMNGFEAGLLTYPYAMHALIASFNILTGLHIENYFMFFTIVLLALLIYFANEQNENRTFLALLFFFLSPIVMTFGPPVLTDIYSSIMFLVGTYFLIKLFEESTSSLAVMNGVSFGLMLLAKPLGAFFYAANLAFLALHKKWKETLYSLAGFAFVSSIYVLLVIPRLATMGERWGFVSMDALLSLEKYAGNFQTLAFSSWMLMIMCPITIIVIALTFGRIVKRRGFYEDPLLEFGVFLFVFYFIFAPLNQWFYDFIGFSRFIWPVLILFSISAAAEAKKLFAERGAIRILSIVIIFGFIIANLTYLGIYSTRSRLLPANYGKPATPEYYNKIKEIIPNEEGIKIYYANADNPIVYGFENVSIVDTHAFPEPKIEPCDFLREKEINYILFWLPQKISPFLFKEFNTKLLESIEKEECGKIEFSQEGWVILFKTKLD